MSAIGLVISGTNPHSVRMSQTIVLSEKRLTELGIYTRLTKILEGNDFDVQDLIIDNFKADLARRIAASVKLVDRESKEVPDLEDARKYNAQLQKDLQHSYNWLSKRQCTLRPLRDSSVQFDGPLQPEIDHVFDASDDDEL